MILTRLDSNIYLIQTPSIYGNCPNKGKKAKLGHRATNDEAKCSLGGVKMCHNMDMLV